MSPDLQELQSSAVALPVKERGQLAGRLLASLDGTDRTDGPAAVARAWTEEADRRYNEYLAGRVEAIHAADARDAIRPELQDRMPAGLEEIEAEALGLPANQRRHLVQRLLASLEDHPAEVDEAAVERAWVAEAERRYAQFLAGEMKAAPLEEVLARIRARPRRV